jgi:hypothetical protein
MTPSILRIAASMLLSTALSAWAATTNHPAEKHKFNTPPSADLQYKVKAKQSGIPLEGDAQVKWLAEKGTFLLLTEMRAMIFGKIIDAKSEGAINAFGLAPSLFTEKRFRKDATTTTFDHDAKTIRFSASNENYPILGGEQDRNSAVWQLISIARGMPQKLKPGTSIDLFVAGQRDADIWTFKVLQPEKIQTAMGDINAVHIIKVNPSESNSQQLDIWLAPSIEWYPLRLRYTDRDGDFIEQTLVNVLHKPS